MSNELDPNLDDDDLMEAMFECQQAIASGDACLMCEAEPQGPSGGPRCLVHAPACLYARVIDLMEERLSTEQYLDQVDQEMGYRYER